MNQLIKLRGHHLILLKEEFWNRGIMTVGTERYYGKRFCDETQRVLTKILDEHSVDVMIVDSYDTLCDADCKKRTPQGCVEYGALRTPQMQAKFDQDVAVQNGIELNKTYTASELLKKLDLDAWEL